MYISMKQARTLLPKVGDIRMERPTEAKQSKPGCIPDPPKKCTVVEVHPDRLWYRVQFESGFYECYKVPKPKTYREVEPR